MYLKIRILFFKLSVLLFGTQIFAQATIQVLVQSAVTKSPPLDKVTITDLTTNQRVMKNTINFELIVL